MRVRIGFVVALLALAGIVGFIVRPSSATTLRGARIGGLSSAFIASWGKPAKTPGGELAWGRCLQTTIYQRVATVLSGRVVGITWNRCAARAFSDSEIRAAVQPVLPPDVKYTQATTKGTVYHSAVLKASGIPPALYLGCNFVPEPAGTLWVGTGRGRDWFAVDLGVGCSNA